MEQYWCLRWLEQERAALGGKDLECGATVLRENLARIDKLPLVVRVPSMPALEPGARVRLGVGAPDLIERQVHCMWHGQIPS
jgi:exoribonuclease-2